MRCLLAPTWSKGGGFWHTALLVSCEPGLGGLPTKWHGNATPSSSGPGQKVGVCSSVSPLACWLLDPTSAGPVPALQAALLSLGGFSCASGQEAPPCQHPAALSLHLTVGQGPPAGLSSGHNCAPRAVCRAAEPGSLTSPRPRLQSDASVVSMGNPWPLFLSLYNFRGIRWNPGTCPLSHVWLLIFPSLILPLPPHSPSNLGFYYLPLA